MAWQVVQRGLGFLEGVGADHQDLGEGGPGFHGGSAARQPAAADDDQKAFSSCHAVRQASLPPRPPQRVLRREASIILLAERMWMHAI